MSEESLYQRLGGHDGITALARTVFNNHCKNEVIKNRYAKSDPENVVQKVGEFMCAGFGGSEKYTGEDMLTAHTGMNISDEEFNAVVNDVMSALDTHNVAQKEKDEILVALWSMRPEIVHV
ncbi:group I truncated hemoglobin [Methylophaga sulfidovorans]|uniref:Hemoglobin n=1 Tax=Methylophaga sulfidovorans TaxID=45496 RepID=A0A1I3UA71_9GAMM|nr:group 1 truncated hemoglobin [Methylophaga sulfidovorans]SFJ80404.1 hemoglobin [Methylophaga sulfidovorans]